MCQILILLILLNDINCEFALYYLYGTVGVQDDKFYFKFNHVILLRGLFADKKSCF